MIENTTGDLLRANVDALVNTVNTEGVMGKGIALQFRRAYPVMYDDYRTACKRGGVQIGKMMVWETGMAMGPRYIINFPTKRHWRSPSRLADIEVGLADLIRVIDDYRITSIAIPPLGAGNGGLAWEKVRPVIVDALKGAQARVLLYEPQGAPDAHRMVTVHKPRELTENRAAFLELVGRYLAVAVGGKPSLIEVQKLMYFLQEAGQGLRLRYGRGPYGPYADNLRQVLIATEGVYTVSFGDGSRPPLDSSLDLLPGAWEAAVKVIDAHPSTRERIDRVMALSGGFDSMYGMELLGTVHWLVMHEFVDATDAAAITEKAGNWTKRKAQIFTQPHIEAAMAHLGGLGWLPSRLSTA